MAYEAYKAYLSITPTDAKNQYIEDLQALANDVFDQASDTLTVQVQDRTTRQWNSMFTRVRKQYQPKSPNTPTVIDDYREIIFQDFNYRPQLGDMFQFEGFYWICTNTDNINSPTSSCLVRRCNNTLKFLDKNRILHTIPAVVTNTLSNLNYNKDITVLNNELLVIVRYDSESDLIQWFDKYTRFIINGEAWRVVGKDKYTFIKSGIGHIILRMQSDSINTATDDLVNGIADGLNVISSPTPQPVGHSIVIEGTATLKQNTQNAYIAKVYTDNVLDTTQSVTWSVSDASKVNIASSTGNQIILKGTTSGVIITLTAMLVSDNSVTQSLNITLKSVFG